MDKNDQFNNMLDETITDRLKRMSVSSLLESLSNFTFSDKVTNIDINTLVETLPNTEEADIATLTAIVRELKLRLT